MADMNIENIVASAKVAKSLNLRKLSKSISNSKYNPEEFSGLILHFNKPKTAVMLFQNGKAICTGAKDMNEVDDAILMTYDKLNDAGTKLYKKPNIKVENMVASLDLQRSFDLKLIAQSMWLENVEYTPKQFPGLIYKMSAPNAVLLIFGSGKIVCTGSKLEDISAAIDKMTNDLSSIGM
jgi:transcription initiation factor TFIID TATA-box-binding protein